METVISNRVRNLIRQKARRWHGKSLTARACRLRFRSQDGAQDLAFAVGTYDRARVLHIDPTLTWNTFVGSIEGDGGYAIAVDSSGNSYVTGQSEAAWGSPVNAYQGGIDAFVAKLGTSGNLIWNVFFGGAQDDEHEGIALDSTSVYLTGASDESWGNPVNAFNDDDAEYGPDAFVAKISDAPTAVNVTGVHGGINKNGNVILHWRTTSETQSAGFNIYRQAKNAEWKMLNAQLKQAKHAGAASSDKYRFIDRKVKAQRTYRYKIQVVYLDGHTEWTDVLRIKVK